MCHATKMPGALSDPHTGAEDRPWESVTVRQNGRHGECSDWGVRRPGQHGVSFVIVRPNWRCYRARGGTRPSANRRIFARSISERCVGDIVTLERLAG